MNSVEHFLFSLENNNKSNKEPKTEFCFIRLYEPAFKTDKAYLFDRAVKIGIDIFSEKIKYKENFSHAAMHYKLTDNFYGLNWFPGEKNDVKVETITKTKDTDSEDPVKSRYAVFSIPLTKTEYNKLKTNIVKYPKSNEFHYSWAGIAKAAGELTKGRITDALHLGKEELDEKTKKIISAKEIDTRKDLVCSTFVMYMLTSISEDYASYFKEQNKNIEAYSPHTLTKLPGIKLLFRGTWINYLKDAKKFVEKNPQFKKYL